MSAARAAVAVLVLAAVSTAVPAVAQVAPRQLVVYPVGAAPGATAEAADVASLLDSALRRVALRTDELVLAVPLVARPACGPARTATPACLAGLSGGGLVLRLTVHRSQGLMVVQMEAVDARAKTFGPVTVSIDAFAQSTEPLVRGALILVDQVIAASRRGDLRAALPPPPPSPAVGQKSVPIPLPPPPVARAPAAASSSGGASASGGWMGAVGPWVTGAGAAALAGGIVIALQNRSLSNELDRKSATGTLTPADLPSYGRVERNDRLARILLGTGGALTLTGVAFWTAGPGGAGAAVAGRF